MASVAGIKSLIFVLIPIAIYLMLVSDVTYKALATLCFKIADFTKHDKFSAVMTSINWKISRMAPLPILRLLHHYFVYLITVIQYIYQSFVSKFTINFHQKLMIVGCLDSSTIFKF